MEIYFKSNIPNGYGWLSNYWPDVPGEIRSAIEPRELRECDGSFEIDGVRYRTVEHFFQAAKFDHNPTLQADIIGQPTAGEAKRAGSLHYHICWFDPKAWDARSADVMLAAVDAKFSQNLPLARALKATGDAQLKEDPGKYPSRWTGSPAEPGLLGAILMKVRDGVKRYVA